jgi:hypothetical protein
MVLEYLALAREGIVVSPDRRRRRRRGSRHRRPPAIDEVEGSSEPKLLRHLPCGGRPQPLAATRHPPDEHVVQRREDPLRRRATVDVAVVVVV